MREDVTHKQLTIRGVGPELHQILRERAARHGLSMNRYVLLLLRQAVGLRPPADQQEEFHDLDHLAGAWSQEEFEAFNNLLAEQRAIDPELWS